MAYLGPADQSGLNFTTFDVQPQDNLGVFGADQTVYVSIDAVNDVPTPVNFEVGHLGSGWLYHELKFRFLVNIKF